MLGFDFHFGPLVALSLEVVETSDLLGLYQSSYEFDHLQNLPLIEESTLCFSLYEISKGLCSKCEFHF